MNPTYQPAMRIISAITNANPLEVTTTFAHNYLTGEIVRLVIPVGFGMNQARNYYGPITVTSPTTFTLPLDSTDFDPFVIPADNPGHFYTQAQVVPIGEVTSMLTGATRNVL